MRGFFAVPVIVIYPLPVFVDKPVAVGAAPELAILGGSAAASAAETVFKENDVHCSFAPSCWT